jgi:2-methylisocitrate lyase-like PEP mutase family enzyme
MLQNPGKALRKLLEEPGILVAPGAYDGISARLIARAGFKAACLTGAGFSATLLGQPDIGLLTMSEVVTHTGNICSAVDIPVIADADTGYGNALNVIRTVHEFEAAGLLP